MDFKNQLINSDWTYIQPNLSNIQKIIIFDDGNQIYQHNSNNCWVIFGEWRGKVALYNKDNNDTIIKSISAWKVTKL